MAPDPDAGFVSFGKMLLANEERRNAYAAEVIAEDGNRTPIERSANVPQIVEVFHQRTSRLDGGKISEGPPAISSELNSGFLVDVLDDVAVEQGADPVASSVLFDDSTSSLKSLKVQGLFNDVTKQNLEDFPAAASGNDDLIDFADCNKSTLEEPMQLVTLDGAGDVDHVSGPVGAVCDLVAVEQRVSGSEYTTIDLPAPALETQSNLAEQASMETKQPQTSQSDEVVAMNAERLRVEQELNFMMAKAVHVINVWDYGPSLDEPSESGPNHNSRSRPAEDLIAAMGLAEAMSMVDDFETFESFEMNMDGNVLKMEDLIEL